MRQLRVLLVTKIFPNAIHPDEAPYNRRQFAALSRYCDVQVLATIPWFPMASKLTKWPVGAGAPAEEVIDGLTVRHPRFLYMPKITPSLNGPLYAASILPEVLQQNPRPDVIVGAFAYPDGYAAVCLGRMLGVPAVVKVHGSDVDVLPNDRRLRGSIQWGLKHAARVVAVSSQLAAGVEALGVPCDRIDTVLNGVDTRVFRPRSRLAARAELGRPAAERTLLFVGALTRDKGILELLKTFEQLALEHSDVHLVIAGRGAEEQACRSAAERQSGRITMTGYLPHDRLSQWMAACDLLVLPSHHEGTPNVVLEALASGRRVVASRVGGIPDVLCDPELGELIPPEDEASLCGALQRALRTPYDPRRVAALAGSLDWDQSARSLHRVLSRAVAADARQLQPADAAQPLSVRRRELENMATW